jgi:hypothetical protein
VPFTPFHLGPGAAFKAIGGRHFSFVVFGGSQVLMDIEPLVRMILGTSILHGPTHTLIGALFIGALASITGKPIGNFALRVLDIPHRPITWRASGIGGFVGTFSHVAFDSVMHDDVRPWWPFFDGGSLLGIVSLGALHLICLALGAVGAIVLAARWFFRI